MTTSVWRDLIMGYRKKHALTQSDAAARLNVSQQTISRWESGKQEPDPGAQAALREQLGMLALTLKESWVQRVSLSTGREYLFEPGWICIAMSEKIANQETFMDPAILGKSLGDVRYFAPLTEALDESRLFSGQTRLARLKVEFNLPDRTVGRVFDLWPILTGTDEILVHAVAYPLPVERAAGATPGIRLIDLSVVPR